MRAGSLYLWSALTALTGCVRTGGVVSEAGVYAGPTMRASSTTAPPAPALAELRRRSELASFKGKASSSALGTRPSPALIAIVGEEPRVESTISTEREASAPSEPDAEVRSEPTRTPRGCPEEMSLLPSGTCIDRWEASLVEVAADGTERPWSPFDPVHKTGARVRAVSKPGVLPQGYVSGVEAEQACKASGKRLCQASEWETACRGSRRSIYPYGNERRAHVCNDDGRARHPVAAVTALYNLPADQLWRRNMVHPMVNQLPNTLLPTGEREECTNDFGVYDMVGNLHEWVADTQGTFRGGFYMDTQVNGEGCLYATTAHGKPYFDYSTGFRCCSDASNE